MLALGFKQCAGNTKCLDAKDADWAEERDGKKPNTKRSRWYNMVCTGAGQKGRAARSQFNPECAVNSVVNLYVTSPHFSQQVYMVLRTR